MAEIRALLLLTHIFLIIVWLGTDLVVFGLSMSLLKRGLPIAIRIDRAHIAEVIDRFVLYSFLLTMPVGLSLARLDRLALFATGWLSLKLVFFGVILLMGVTMLTGAAGTTQTLENIGAGKGDVEALESDLRRRIIWLAFPVQVVYLSILAIIFIAVRK
jgi:hypothetical protein